MIASLVRVAVAIVMTSILAAAAGCCCPCGSLPNIPTGAVGPSLPERAPVYRAAADMAH